MADAAALREKGHRLYFATPTGGHPVPMYTSCVREMEMGCRTFERGPRDFAFMKAPVQMARTAIVSEMLAQDYDYLVMLDDDMFVESSGPAGNALDAWHELMDANPKVGMVGAVYLRERPAMPTVMVPHPEHPEELCSVVAGFQYQPTEVGAVGTGFVMIRRAAIEAIADELPHFRFAHRRNFTGGWSEMGEDFDFCTRLRKAGYQVLADPRFATLHQKDSGRLRYDWHEWEPAWSADGANVKGLAKELRESIGSDVVATVIDGFLALDHIPALLKAAEGRKAA